MPIGGRRSWGTALLVVPAVLLLGGVELWQAYFAKISLHVSGFGANQVGLRTLLDGSPVLLWIARGLIAGAFVLSVRQVSASQAAILGGVLIYAFGYLSNYYYCLLAVFCLWDELPVARLRSVVRCGALFAIPGVCAALIVTSTAEIAVYDKPAYFAASLACLAACTLLFVELLGGQLLGLLYASQRLLRRWGSSVLRPLRSGRVYGRPVGLAARNALINSLTKRLVFRPKP